MLSNRRRFLALACSLGSAVALVSGCQTHFGGMTLPSPHYLKHPPQYFIPDPDFPLQRELDSMMDPDGAARRSNAGAAPVMAAPANAVLPAATAPVPR